MHGYMYDANKALYLNCEPLSSMTWGSSPPAGPV